MQIQKVYHEDGQPTIQKAAGRERPATGKRTRGPTVLQNRRTPRAAPTALSFSCRPGRKQSEPLPTVETG